MPQNTLNTHICETETDCPMPKDWMQIRIEKETSKGLDEVHIERKESYNDIIIRLIQFWKDHPKIVEKWIEEKSKK